jgi:DNA-binding MarR family transcriptional regulator
MTEARRKAIQEVMEAMVSIKGALYQGHGPMFLKHGIGRPHFMIMMKMAGSDDGVSVTELSAALNVTPGAVTQFIDKLVDKGLAERYEDPKDRRVVRIKLTDKSKNRFKQMKEFHFDRLSKMFVSLTDEELRQLAELIKKIEVDHEDIKSGRWHNIKSHSKK